PDVTLEEARADSSSIDFDLGALPETGEENAGQEKEKSDFTPEGTLIMGNQEPESTLGGLDFDLNLAAGEKPAEDTAKAAAPAPDASTGLEFDLDLDLGAPAGDDPSQAAAPALDLSDISLDLGTETATSGAANDDPKWQEVAT